MLIQFIEVYYNFLITRIIISTQGHWIPIYKREQEAIYINHSIQIKFTNGLEFST